LGCGKNEKTEPAGGKGREMINTRNMHKLAGYDYYGIAEEAFRMGDRYYISIIDHRATDTKLDGIFDELGVRRVSLGYVQRWAQSRGVTLA
jgi:hypothetical protein